MKQDRPRTAALLGVTVLIVGALAGCGPRQTSPLPPVPATAGPTPGETVSGAVPSDASAEPSPTPAGPATPDPVASELDQINQLINDIDNSVQSSDSSQQGGE